MITNRKPYSQETRTSSVIDNISYDAYKKELKVRFLATGHSYIYRDVPIQIYNEMKAAASTGSYFNTYIKHTYQYRIL